MQRVVEERIELPEHDPEIDGYAESPSLFHKVFNLRRSERSFQARLLLRQLVAQTERDELLERMQQPPALCTRSRNAEAQLPRNFDTFYPLSLLHFWIVNTKLRRCGVEGAKLGQELYDQFWSYCQEVLLKQREHYQNPMVYSRDLKVYNSMYYGSLFGYDDGLLKCAPAFAEAIWR